MIHFGQYSESERPGSGDRKAPPTKPANQPARQRPVAGVAVTTGRRPEVAA